MVQAKLRLLRNDPQRPWAEIEFDLPRTQQAFPEIELDAEQDDAATIAHALQQNDREEHVSVIKLEASSLRGYALWGNLLQVLATRGDRVQVELKAEAPPEMNRAIFQAMIQQSSVFRGVEFRLMNHVAEDFCSFLDTAAHLTDLTLSGCHIRGGPQGATDIAAALQRNTNITTLKLYYNNFNDRLDLCPVLRRPDSPLRHFDFRGHNLGIPALKTLCEAVAESKLESFSIGQIDSLARLHILADAIPSMKIRKLVITFRNFDRIPDAKQTLHQAVKNNFTLQSVEFVFVFPAGRPEGWRDQDNDAFLTFSMERNMRLAKWVEDPSTLPKHLWKQALELAVKAGPDTFYRIFQKIGPEVLAMERNREILQVMQDTLDEWKNRFCTEEEPWIANLLGDMDALLKRAGPPE